MQATIYTERLLPSRVERLDVGFLAFCLGSKEAHGPYLSTPLILPEAVAERFARGAYWNNKVKMFIIKRKQGLMRLGIFHYWTTPTDPATVRYAILIAVEDQRNLGFGTETQAGAIGALFQQSHIRRIEVFTDTENRSEARCLEKVGFRLFDTRTYTDVDVERNGKCDIMGQFSAHSAVVIGQWSVM